MLALIFDLSGKTIKHEKTFYLIPSVLFVPSIVFNLSHLIVFAFFTDHQQSMISSSLALTYSEMILGIMVLSAMSLLLLVRATGNSKRYQTGFLWLSAFSLLYCMVNLAAGGSEALLSASSAAVGVVVLTLVPFVSILFHNGGKKAYE